MVERKSLKINVDIYNTLMEIKELNNYKSINETLNKILPTGVVNNTDYETEPPAFTIKDNTISWTTLKKSEINTEWKSEDETEIAIILFKDKYGALVRFQFENDFFVNYFHFLK